MITTIDWDSRQQGLGDLFALGFGCLRSIDGGDDVDVVIDLLYRVLWLFVEHSAT